MESESSPENCLWTLPQPSQLEVAQELAQGSGGLDVEELLRGDGRQTAAGRQHPERLLEEEDVEVKPAADGAVFLAVLEPFAVAQLQDGHVRRVADNEVELLGGSCQEIRLADLDLGQVPEPVAGRDSAVGVQLHPDDLGQRPAIGLAGPDCPVDELPFAAPRVQQVSRCGRPGPPKSLPTMRPTVSAGVGTKPFTGTASAWVVWRAKECRKIGRPKEMARIPASISTENHARQAPFSIRGAPQRSGAPATP